MSDNTTRPLLRSLEILSDKRGDPTREIYARFYEVHPEFEALFHLDPNWDVRGEMLSQAFDVLMKLEAGEPMGEALLSANRMTHEGYGVPNDRFAEFFVILKDVTRSALGEVWSADMDDAWEAALQRVQMTEPY